jgi:hypothetical protein
MTTNRRGIDPTIIAAVIGVLGTLCVTLVTLYANRVLSPPQPTQPPSQPTGVVPTWTASPTITITDTPVPTDTVPAGDPTSTPAPNTPTLEATFTPVTPAPPAIGSDWVNGCISVLWKPFPETVQTTERDGCLVEPVNLFFAADGRLTFSVNEQFNDDQVFGLFAPLTANGLASVQTFLRRLQDGEIWIGVFAEPTLESQGMIIVIPPGDINTRPMIQKSMPGQIEVKQTEHFSRNPPLYDVFFEFGNNSVRAIVMQNTNLDPLPVVSVQPWLFVGYQVKNGNNRIDAEFLNLVVQAQ